VYYPVDGLLNKVLLTLAKDKLYNIKVSKENVRN
jgi:hypothetical protein